MRRYGYQRYGGFGNDYPGKEQPDAFRTPNPLPGSTVAQLFLAPPDIMPRRPSRPQELPAAPPLDEAGGGVSAEQIIDRLLSRMRNEPFAYNVFDALRYVRVKNLNFVAGMGDLVVLDNATDLRTYLFIQNTHPLNTLFFTFETTASANIGIPLAPAGVGSVAGGFYEMIAPISQDAIHVSASAPLTTGVLAYAELDPRILNRRAGKP